MGNLLGADEIIDYASQYVNPGEEIDFPMEGDVFVLLVKNSTDIQYSFGGYFICIGYELNYESKVEGSWIIMNYFSLSSMPPTKGTFNLQSPHIVKGFWDSSDRSKNFKMFKVYDTEINNLVGEYNVTPKVETEKDNSNIENEPVNESKILQFRKRS